MRVQELNDPVRSSLTAIVSFNTDYIDMISSASYSLVSKFSESMRKRQPPPEPSSAAQIFAPASSPTQASSAETKGIHPGYRHRGTEACVTFAWT
jgi:hypothetical protein